MMKMICFPHAGGISNYYSFLINAKYKNIDEVIVYEYPKRALKINVEEYKDFQDAVNIISNDLIVSGYCDNGYVLFGHSMGAFIAYEIGQKLKNKFQIAPEFIVVSGQKPPCKVEPIHYAECEKAGIDYLKKLGGVADIVMQHSNLMKYFWELCVQDFRLLQTYSPNIADVKEKLSKGAVICGKNDIEVDIDDLPLWSEYIEDVVDMEICEGNHFYFTENEQKLVDFINKCL